MSHIKEQQSYPGDDVIPNANMIYNQTRLIHASPDDIYPWLVQVGKGRGGWYLTTFWELFFPTSWHASRRIEPQWQQLKVGDRIPDYGTKDDYFDVALLNPPHAIVFHTERFGLPFSWTLMVRAAGEGMADELSVVHLRFRGRLQATGIKRRAFVFFGGIMDYISTAPMLAGLAERVERQHVL